MIKVIAWYMLTCVVIAIDSLAMQQCNLKYSQFLLVRKTTRTSHWFPQDDRLQGTETTGLYGDEQYSITWSGLIFSHMLLIQNTLQEWMMFSQSELASMASTSWNNYVSLMTIVKGTDPYSNSRGCYLTHSTTVHPIVFSYYYWDDQQYFHANAATFSWYLGGDSSSYTQNLISGQGMSIYILITTSNHYQIKSSEQFTQLLFVSVQSELYIDIFPSFHYYANSPLELWLGGFDSTTWNNYQLSSFDGQTLDSCNELCVKNAQCQNFFYTFQGADQGKCLLYKQGVGYGANSDQKYYLKHDVVDMNSCPMASHIMTTLQSDKINCQDKYPCDRLVIDVINQGLYTYQITPYGGPGNHGTQVTRTIRVCPEYTIGPQAAINLNQQAYVNDQIIGVYVPSYFNTLQDCPDVTFYQIFESDCTTISTAVDMTNFQSSLVDKYFFAPLIDKTTPKEYDLCLGVFTIIQSVIVRDLKFTLKADCTQTLSRNNTALLPVTTLYSNSTKSIQIYQQSELVINSDNTYCPILETEINILGCNSPLSGSTISMNSANDTLALKNSLTKVSIGYCLVFKNQNQTIKVDQLFFYQMEPCENTIKVDPQALDTNMNSDPSGQELFEIEYKSKSSSRLDVRDYIQSIDNPECLNATIQTCQQNVCTNSSQFQIIPSNKNETKSIVIKFEIGEETFEKTIKVKYIVSETQSFGVNISNVTSPIQNNPSTQDVSQTSTSSSNSSESQASKKSTSSGSSTSSNQQKSYSNQNSNQHNDKNKNQTKEKDKEVFHLDTSAKSEINGYDWIQQQIQNQKSRQKAKQFESKGLRKFDNWWLFPGQSEKEMMKLKNKNKNPQLKNVTVLNLNSSADIVIQFQDPIMIVEMTQTFWDLLFEIELISLVDDQKYVGHFFNFRRNLQNRTKNNLQFQPIIKEYKENEIIINLKLSNNSYFKQSQQAQYKLTIKNPELLVNKFTGIPYVKEQFPGDGQIIQPVPAQFQDVKFMKKVTKQTHTSSYTVTFMYILAFLGNAIKSYTMQNFFESVRTLKIIHSLTMIRFPILALMQIILDQQSNFAQQDVLNAETIFNQYFDLVETQPLNEQFALFGSDGNIFYINTGSYFTMILIIIVLYIISKIINKFTLLFSQIKQCRKIGIYVYKGSLMSRVTSQIEKLNIEGYFDIMLAVLLNFRQLYSDNSNFHKYFSGLGNISNSVFCFGFGILLPIYVLYMDIQIRKGQSKFVEKPDILLEKHENWTEFMHCKYLSSSLFNVCFIYKRTIIALSMVLLTSFPYFQIMIVEVITIINYMHLMGCRPYQNKISNLIETANEVLVLICIYTIKIMMMLPSDQMNEYMTIVYIITLSITIVFFFILLVINTITQFQNDKKTQKKEVFEQKQSEQWTRVIYDHKPILGAQFEQLERGVEAVVALQQKEAKWIPQREWLLSNGKDIRQFEEEKILFIIPQTIQQTYLQMLQVCDRAKRSNSYKQRCPQNHKVIYKALGMKTLECSLSCSLCHLAIKKDYLKCLQCKQYYHYPCILNKKEKTIIFPLIKQEEEDQLTTSKENRFIEVELKKSGLKKSQIVSRSNKQINLSIIEEEKSAEVESLKGLQLEESKLSMEFNEGRRKRKMYKREILN